MSKIRPTFGELEKMIEIIENNKNNNFIFQSNINKEIITNYKFKSKHVIHIANSINEFKKIMLESQNFKNEFDGYKNSIIFLWLGNIDSISIDNFDAIKIFADINLHNEFLNIVFITKNLFMHDFNQNFKALSCRCKTFKLENTELA